jgi:hypothetical protein
LLCEFNEKMQQNSLALGLGMIGLDRHWSLLISLVTLFIVLSKRELIHENAPESFQRADLLTFGFQLNLHLSQSTCHFLCIFLMTIYFKVIISLSHSMVKLLEKLN